MRSVSTLWCQLEAVTLKSAGQTEESIINSKVFSCGASLTHGDILDENT